MNLGVEAVIDEPSLLIEPYTSRSKEDDRAGALGYGSAGVAELFL
jgi:hypothetical protein